MGKTRRKMEALIPTCIDSLPLDILLKILTSLPSKSAVSFKCTSKFFHSSIPPPLFASLLFSFPSTAHPTNLYTVGFTKESQGRLQATSLQCSEKLHSFDGLVGSSFVDGKLFLFNNYGETALWDLSTRQHISLPRTQLDGPWYLFPGDEGILPWTKLHYSAALGFDLISKRYKVLKLESYRNNVHHQYQGMLKILTLGVDESWREVMVNFIPGKPIANVQVDDIIYLIYCNINCKDKHEIVAFDVGTENLRMIHFSRLFQPYLPAMRYSSWIKLNGLLAFIYVTVNGPRTDIYVCTLMKSREWWMEWVPLTMEESKIISQAETMSLATNSIGEIVFLIRANGMSLSILLYDFEREVWKKFEIGGLSDYAPTFDNWRSIVHVTKENVYFPE